MIGRLVILASVLALLVGCAETQPSRGSGSPSQTTGPQKTISIGISNAVSALSIMGSSTTSGGWQSLNELHSQGLVTADRDIQRPVPRLATEVPTFDNGGIELLPDGR